MLSLVAEDVISMLSILYMKCETKTRHPRLIYMYKTYSSGLGYRAATCAHGVLPAVQKGLESGAGSYLIAASLVSPL